MILPRIESERLCLRQFEMNDWQALYAYIGDPDVMTYIPEGQFTSEQAKTFVQKQLKEAAEAFPVILKSDNRLIGHISFHPWFSPRIYEIGWVFHPDYYGKGYATEAARTMLGYGFEKLNVHRVIATCQPENIGSYRVMEKLGMTREGHLRQCIERENGVWWDEYFYAILAQEWSSAEKTP